MPSSVYENVEYSIIEYLIEEAEDVGLDTVRVEKGFSAVETGCLPLISVMLFDSSPKGKEVGSPTLTEKPLMIINIFATKDAERLTLARFVIDSLSKINKPYYRYTIEDGEVTLRNRQGNFNVVSYLENTRAFEKMEGLEKEDMFRHKISFTVSVGDLR